MAGVAAEGAEEGIETALGGGLTGVLIGSFSALSTIISINQAECIINTLKGWEKGKISMSPNVVNPQNETVRPAITFAFDIVNNQVKVPDLLGHGLLVTTKDQHFLYIGRLSPNWARVAIAQGGYVTDKFIGKRAAQFVGQELSKAAKTLSEYLGMPSQPISLDTLEFGVLDLGPVSKYQQRSGKAWVNPLHMQQCKSNNWLGDIASWLENFANDFLVQDRMTAIPLYTLYLLQYFGNLNPPTDYKFDKSHYYYSINPERGEENLKTISSIYPLYYFTVTLKKWVGGTTTYAFSYANFIGNHIRARDLSYYSIDEILKVGIGSPLQSSNYCVNYCSQFGNFGQNVGIGKISVLTSSQYVYIAVPHPNYADMTTEEIKNYYQETLGLGNLIDYFLAFGVIMIPIMEELEKKYNPYVAYFTYLQTPVTNNESEARNEANQIAEIGNKIYQRAREILINSGMYEAANFVGECLVEVADAYGDINQQINNVVQCAIQKAGPEEFRFRPE